MEHQKRSLTGNMSFPIKLTLAIILMVLLVTIIISVAAFTAASRPILDLESSIMIRAAESASERTYEYFTVLDTFLTDMFRQDPMLSIRSGRLAASDLHNQENGLSLLLEGAIYSYRSRSLDGLGIQFFSLHLKSGLSVSTLTRDQLPFNDYNQCNDYLQSLDKAGGNENNSGWYGPLSVYANSRNKQNSCLYIRSVFDTSGRRMAFLITGISETTLSQLYGSVFPEGCIMLRDQTILSTPQTALLGTNLKLPDASNVFHKYESGRYVYRDHQNNPRDVLYRILPGNSTCLLLPTSTPTGVKSEKLYRFATSTLVIAISAMLLSALLAFFLSRKLTGSVLSLKALVQQVYEGDLKARYRPAGNDEIAYLGIKINDMLDQVEDLFITQEQDAVEKRNLELRLLQAQINPHLIYNTLSSAIWALRNNDKSKTERLLFLLSDFFRLSLSNGLEQISLEAELELVRYYVMLQNLLKHAEYELALDVDQELISSPVLCMTLQPLVENSIIHGFYEMHSGRIRITGRLTDSKKMLLQVIDDGAGIPPDIVAALNQSFAEKMPLTRGSNHYGLYNINRRIQNKYGRDYGLSIKSELDECTECSILLPHDGNHPRKSDHE